MDESDRLIAELRQANMGLAKIVDEQAEELHVWRRDGGQALIDKQDAHHLLHRRNLEVEALRAGFAVAHHQLHARNLEVEALRRDLAEAHHQLDSRNKLIIELQSRLESAR